MFTNLDFLNVGQPWIPNNVTFRKRQDNYITGRLLYEGEFEQVFGQVWKEIVSRYGKDYKSLEQTMVQINLFKALTETFKTLAFQKEPEIWVGEGENAQRIEEVYSRKKALDILKKSFVSGHAQGDAVLKVYTNSNDEPDISVVNPENWIPVYNPDNLDEVTAHVVANTYEVDNSTSLLGVVVSNVQKYLNVEIHYKGYYEKRLYKLNNQNIIQSLVSKEENILTGYDGFTVFPFNYGTPAWRDYGVTAYWDLIPIVDEIVVRLSNNSGILNEHSDPQLIAPEEALEFDANSGQWVYKRHQVLKIGKNGEMPAYLTWDGNLTNSENQLNRVMDLFYTLSGTNPQLFGQDIAGNLSGEALAKILIIPIAKTKEMILNLEDACEQAFNCMLQMRGIKETCDIKFEIGQFNTESDITARVVQEKNAGITSLKRAVEQINPRYTDEEVDEEVAMIKDDRNSDSMTDLEGLFPKDEEDGEEKPVNEA